MDTPRSPSIAALIGERRRNYSLPAGLYTRPDVFEADVEVFFENQWILAGLECEIKEPGDAQVVEVGRSSIILVRDDNGDLRAWHNVCRHRGARILEPGPAVISKLVCPYHQWTYEPSGELIHAPHMGAQFDKRCRSLKPVPLRSIGGLIYVCLSGKPPQDIDVLQQVMAPRLAPYGIRNAKVAHQTDVIEKGNWKLTMENNRECYHCIGSHPELCVSFIDLDFGFDPASLSDEARMAAQRHFQSLEERVQQWEAEGYPSQAVARVSPDVNTNFRTQRLALAGKGESQTPDATAACSRLLGTMTRKDLGDTHLWGHNSWNHFMGDHAVSAMVIPLSADKTLVRTKWLVHEDAVEGVDYDLHKLTSVWIATTDQDAELVARAHAGVLDPAYEPGLYSEFAERELDNFAAWYLQKLKNHGY
jgi:Rieske 2Fe-2S family protein